MPGAVLSWGIDAGGLLGLRQIVKARRVDHVVDVRQGRARPGTSMVDVAKSVEKWGAIYSFIPPATAFVDARGGRHILVLGADPSPWFCPRHLAYLLPIAQDMARYAMSGMAQVITPFEIGHIIGRRLWDPLNPPQPETGSAGSAPPSSRRT